MQHLYRDQIWVAGLSYKTLFLAVNFTAFNCDAPLRHPLTCNTIVQADRDLWVVDEASQASAMWKTNKFGYGTFGSTRMYDSGYATVESQKIKLNLAGFSG